MDNRPEKKVKVTEEEVEEILSLPDAFKPIPEQELFAFEIKHKNKVQVRQRAKELGISQSEVINLALYHYFIHHKL